MIVVIIYGRRTGCLGVCPQTVTGYRMIPVKYYLVGVRASQVLGDTRAPLKLKGLFG